MKRTATIIFLVFLSVHLHAHRIYAADNMCNVNPGTCSTPQQWEQGWGDARKPENINAVPQQPEYTQRNESNDGTKPPDRPVEIIRLAGERNNVNRSDIAAGYAKNHGGDPINSSIRTHDRIRLDKNLQPIASGANPFGNKSGIHTSIGKDCDDYQGATSDTGASGLKCHGEVTINICTGGPTSDPKGSCTPNSKGTCDKGPKCVNPTQTLTGDFDCVEIANRECAFVQLDTPNGSAITCYPTNCASAPATGTPPGVNQPPPSSGENGQNQPPPPADTPTPTPRRRRKPTPTPTRKPTPTPTLTPSPTPVATCEYIKVYDADNNDITTAIKDGTRKLTPGDSIVLATLKGQATKAHFRIQGIADWTENDTTKTTDTEYRLQFQIPTTMTQAQGTFEVEVFVNGQWK